MAVHFKFRAEKDYNSVNFDGHFIPLMTLKERIIEHKNLGNNYDVDLVITDAQTGEEYTDDNFPVPRNTSVIIKRVPAMRTKPIVHVAEELKGPPASVPESKSGKVESAKELPSYAIPSLSPMEEFAEDIYAPAPAPALFDEEAARISAALNKSNTDWERTYQDAPAMGRGRGGRGGGRGGPGGRWQQFSGRSNTPPEGYVCHRCGQSGHFIQHCPTNGDPKYDIKRVKPPSGIPRTRLRVDHEGSYILPDGSVAVMQPDESHFLKDADVFLSAKQQVRELPPELKCPLCHGIFRDAVIIPCCGVSFCDSCIREELIAKGQCPHCGVSKYTNDDLLPNMSLRQAIESFKESQVAMAVDDLLYRPAASQRHLPPSSSGPAGSGAAGASSQPMPPSFGALRQASEGGGSAGSGAAGRARQPSPLRPAVSESAAGSVGRSAGSAGLGEQARPRAPTSSPEPGSHPQGAANAAPKLDVAASSGANREAAAGRQELAQEDRQPGGPLAGGGIDEGDEGSEGVVGPSKEATSAGREQQAPALTAGEAESKQGADGTAAPQDGAKTAADKDGEKAVKKKKKKVRAAAPDGAAAAAAEGGALAAKASKAPGGAPVCSHCGEPGHIARECSWGGGYPPYPGGYGPGGGGPMHDMPPYGPFGGGGGGGGMMGGGGGGGGDGFWGGGPPGPGHMHPMRPPPGHYAGGGGYGGGPRHPGDDFYGGGEGVGMGMGMGGGMGFGMGGFEHPMEMGMGMGMGPGPFGGPYGPGPRPPFMRPPPMGFGNGYPNDGPYFDDGPPMHGGFMRPPPPMGMGPGPARGGLRGAMGLDPDMDMGMGMNPGMGMGRPPHLPPERPVLSREEFQEMQENARRRRLLKEQQEKRRARLSQVDDRDLGNDVGSNVEFPEGGNYVEKKARRREAECAPSWEKGLRAQSRLEDDEDIYRQERPPAERPRSVGSSRRSADRRSSLRVDEGEEEGNRLSPRNARPHGRRDYEYDDSAYDDRGYEAGRRRPSARDRLDPAYDQQQQQQHEYVDDDRYSTRDRMYFDEEGPARGGPKMSKMPRSSERSAKEDVRLVDEYVEESEREGRVKRSSGSKVGSRSKDRRKGELHDDVAAVVEVGGKKHKEKRSKHARADDEGEGDYKRKSRARSTADVYGDDARYVSREYDSESDEELRPKLERSDSALKRKKKRESYHDDEEALPGRSREQIDKDESKKKSKRVKSKSKSDQDGHSRLHEGDEKESLKKGRKHKKHRDETVCSGEEDEDLDSKQKSKKLKSGKIVGYPASKDSEVPDARWPILAGLSTKKMLRQ